MKALSFLAFFFFLPISKASDCVERLDESVASLIQLGYHPSFAAGIQKHLPDAVYYLMERKRQLGTGLYILKPMNTEALDSEQKYVTLYRGINTTGAEEFVFRNLDLRMLEGQPVGAINVASDIEIARRSGIPNEDRPYGFLLTFRIPRELVQAGKYPEAYVIYSDSIAKKGFTNWDDFIIGIEKQGEYKPKRKKASSK